MLKRSQTVPHHTFHVVKGRPCRCSQINCFLEMCLLLTGTLLFFIVLEGKNGDAVIDECLNTIYLSMEGTSNTIPEA